ncbi:OmpA family protein [Vibrio rumoiensis]|uniref:OmpA family protein n=1 Tax=Vibrio rumoiensis TaxID=76258 RepID=UPI003AA8B855
MKFKATLALSILFLVTFNRVNADTLPFDEVKWKTVNKVDSCSIQSDFDRLGYRLTFTKEAGEADMQLQLSGWKVGGSKEPQNRITFYSESPSWSQEQAARQVITQVNHYRHGDTLKGKKVNAILGALRQGYWLTIESDRYSVTLPNTGIFDIVESFNVCLTKLPKTTYKNAYNTKLYFRLNQKELSKSNKEAVAELASLIKKDASIKKVMVDGYTDNVGSSVTNLAVSKARAKTIAYQLTVEGVSSNLIRVTGQGERFPMASNETALGRDRNRRVEIRLIR